MRLYASKITAIAQDIVNELITQELVEVEFANRSEVQLDAEAVMKEYIRRERQMTEQAKDIAHQRGLDYSAHQKIKRQIAKKQKFGLYDESIGYLCSQLIETFLQSRHVDEIYGEDNDLRVALAPLLRKHLATGDELDAEVRKRMKNLTEGGQDWEIRYQQTMERLQQLKGLSED